MGGNDKSLKEAADAASRVPVVKLRSANGEGWTIYINTIFNIYGAGLMVIASKRVAYPEWYSANEEGDDKYTATAKAKLLAEANTMMGNLSEAQKAVLKKAGGDVYFLNGHQEQESSRTDATRTKVAAKMCESLEGSWAASLFEEGGTINRRDITALYARVTERLQEKSTILAWKRVSSLINFTWTPGYDINTFVQRKKNLYAECQLMLPMLVVPDSIFVGQLLATTITVDTLKNETEDLERKNLLKPLTLVEVGIALSIIQERDSTRSLWQSSTRSDRAGTPASKATALLAATSTTSGVSLQDVQECLNHAFALRANNTDYGSQPSHEGENIAGECWTWRDTGTCKWDSACRFSHDGTAKESTKGRSSGKKNFQPKKKGELCTKCGLPGHTATTCTTSVKSILQLAQSKKVNGFACLAVDLSTSTSNTEVSRTRVACLRSMAAISPTVTGYLDSGSNHTIFPASAPLVDIQACNYAIHGVDSRNSIAVKQKGSLDTVTASGTRLPFSDVLRSEHVENALFSVGHFDKAGFTTIFGDGKATIVPTHLLKWSADEITTVATMDDQGMYPLTLDVCVPPALAKAEVGGASAKALSAATMPTSCVPTQRMKLPAKRLLSRANGVADKR